MRAILILAFLGLTLCRANAQSIEALDCVSAESPSNVLTYIFDKSSSTVQYISGSSSDPRFNAQHGLIFPAAITDVALIAHAQRPNDEPYFDMAISRINGEAHYEIPVQIPVPGKKRFDLKCTPSKRYAAFVKPNLSFDASGEMALSCQRLPMPSKENPTPVPDASFDLKTTFHRNAMTVAELDQASPPQSSVVGRILSIYPNRVRICYLDSCDKTFAVLNLVTGVLEAFSAPLMPTGDFLQCRQR
jgi:hypothetical protein